MEINAYTAFASSAKQFYVRATIKYHTDMHITYTQRYMLFSSIDNTNGNELSIKSQSLFELTSSSNNNSNKTSWRNG